MAEWFYQLVDFCRVDRDNVAVAVSYLDRFLGAAARSGNARARRCLADRREYQLCAMTCLYLAVNLAETKEMDTALLVELSHGKYSKSDFVTMAEDVTWGLGWRLNGPTSMAFVNHLLGVLPEEGQHKSLHHLHDRHFLPACCRRAALVREEATLHELCRTQAELAVSDYRLASCRPSDVATAAVRNAMEHVRPDDLLAFLKSMDALDINPFSAEVERARTILKSAFDANVDGLRQVTSLLRLREEAANAAAGADNNNDIRGIRRSSITDSARCVTEIERIQNQSKFRRENIGEGATP
uniref:Cyclin N-terminal domain-containing protein n=1 Tax=Pseudictyota dubia TaxID=2749911 RepID=A0A7R9W751_9STRA